MNKKALQTVPFGVIFGLIIGIIFVLIILNIASKFTSNNNQGHDTVTFYFTTLAKDLNEVKFGDVKSSSFLTKNDFILLGFNKDVSIIKTTELDNSCIPYKLLKDIEKPVKCRDKNCLCLCKADLDIAFTGTLFVDCNADEAKCVELPLKINPSKSCKTFILYDKEEKVYNLNLKKESDAFSINPSLPK